MPLSTLLPLPFFSFHPQQRFQHVSPSAKLLSKHQGTTWAHTWRLYHLALSMAVMLATMCKGTWAEMENTLMTQGPRYSLAWA